MLLDFISVDDNASGYKIRFFITANLKSKDISLNDTFFD